MSGHNGLSCSECNCKTPTGQATLELQPTVDFNTIYFIELSFDDAWTELDGHRSDAWVLFEQFYTIIDGERIDLLSGANCDGTGKKAVLLKADIGSSSGPEKAFCDHTDVLLAAKESKTEKLIFRLSESISQFSVDVWHNTKDKNPNFYGLPNIHYNGFVRENISTTYPQVLDLGTETFTKKSKFIMATNQLFDILPTNLKKKFSIKFDVKVLDEFMPEADDDGGILGSSTISLLLVSSQYPTDRNLDDLKDGTDDKDEKHYPIYSVDIDSSGQ